MVLKMNNLIISYFTKYSAMSLSNLPKLLDVHTVPVLNLLKRCSNASYHTNRSELIKEDNLKKDFDYDNESPYSNIDFAEVTKGDEDRIKALKILQLELDIMYQQGQQVPTRISTSCWQYLLTISSTKERNIFLRRLWKREMRQKSSEEEEKMKSYSYKEFKARQAQTGPKVINTISSIKYGLTDTSLFHRIRDKTIKRFYEYRLHHAAWFGPKIIIDCSYEPYMNIHNLNICTKQMMIMWWHNRVSRNPYNILFCNVDEQSNMWQRFAYSTINAHEVSSPVNFTNKHYLDLFPKEKLVYLTSHCHQTLFEYNHDDIYIIGAVATPLHSQPLSLVKAKKDGLRTAKLPLYQYPEITAYQKTLPMNIVFDVLNDVKDGLSWQKAFEHVPKDNINLNGKYENKKNTNPDRIKDTCERNRIDLIWDLLFKYRS